jgi:opacity protein-like surface antigen
VDLRQNKFGEAKVDVIPLQLSLMVYLMPPGYRFVPYVLAGGGWYYTHVYAPVDRSGFRFGPHLGAGADFFLDRSWSIDASYRYLWTEDIHSQDIEHPLGRNFRDKGFMITLAVNYYF